jgi:hypothetical protein
MLWAIFCLVTWTVSLQHNLLSGFVQLLIKRLYYTHSASCCAWLNHLQRIVQTVWSITTFDYSPSNLLLAFISYLFTWRKHPILFATRYQSFIIDLRKVSLILLLNSNLSKLWLLHNTLCKRLARADCGQIVILLRVHRRWRSWLDSSIH